MTDKTPEELAMKYAAERSRAIDDGDSTYYDLLDTWLEGYHSRDAEIAELKKRLAKAEDPYGE